MTARGSNEIVSTRTLAAPRERVWRAFADPVQLAQWWGPAGFTNSFHEFDLCAGGVWRYTMTGPDGTRYEQARKVVEFASLERIVIENPDPAHSFRMTMTFAPNVEGTLVSWRMSFESSEEFARVKDFIAAANEENFDRLAALLTEES